jgi:hypothetical protein
VQEKENLKKIIDDIWDYHNHRLFIDQMNEKGYDSEAVFAISDLYTALQNLVDRSKFQDKLQTFQLYDMPYSTKKYDNNISMLKAFVDLNLDLTSFQKIKEQLKLGPEFFGSLKSDFTFKNLFKKSTDFIFRNFF